MGAAGVAAWAGGDVDHCGEAERARCPLRGWWAADRVDQRVLRHGGGAGQQGGLEITSTHEVAPSRSERNRTC